MSIRAVSPNAAAFVQPAKPEAEARAALPTAGSPAEQRAQFAGIALEEVIGAGFTGSFTTKGTLDGQKVRIHFDDIANMPFNWGEKFALPGGPWHVEVKGGGLRSMTPAELEGLRDAYKNVLSATPTFNGQTILGRMNVGEQAARGQQPLAAGDVFVG